MKKIFNNEYSVSTVKVMGISKFFSLKGAVVTMDELASSYCFSAHFFPRL